ncbi:hypothetical protein FGADI_4923 [Fusarium gaditjirri]|uniref:Uncharacterized protein n=1 Tax=Fusarium gaditjirri TaxID=282569 RepID=A0A8H4TBM5_9HYPO|nr:hypothetical protein FGADI_4923 [Fusarium gaditjirri]
MPGQDNLDALLDPNDLLTPDPATFGLLKMARAAATETVKSAAYRAWGPTATITATETATATVTVTATGAGIEAEKLKEYVQKILDCEDSYVMVTFAVIAGLALLLSIVTIFSASRSFSKVKASMQALGEDDNGLGQGVYKCYSKAQKNLIFLILSVLCCIATFILATANIMLLDNIDGSIIFLSVAYGAQVLTLICIIMASHSLMRNTLLNTSALSEDGDLEVNAWDSKL